MQTVFSANDVSQLLTAVKFTADKHRDHRREGADESPYINHPLDVAETMWRVGEVRDLSTVTAAFTCPNLVFATQPLKELLQPYPAEEMTSHPGEDARQQRAQQRCGIDRAVAHQLHLVIYIVREILRQLQGRKKSWQTSQSSSTRNTSRRNLANWRMRPWKPSPG